MKRRIYMDNAATSFPKPPEVTAAMVHFMQNVGANPGRSRHDRADQASLVVEGAREKLARLFNVPDPKRIVFSLNATEALNTVIMGTLNPGDHMLMTQMEHNSVIRPVRHLEREGIITASVVPCDRMGVVDVDALKRLIRPNTALVALNHASNVCGTIQDVMAVREAVQDIPLLLDAAQTAGAVPIDVQAMGIDFLAFTGHKALFGPQGTGGLYVRDGLSIRPLKRGGTGSVSESEEQPEFFSRCPGKRNEEQCGHRRPVRGSGFCSEHRSGDDTSARNGDHGGIDRRSYRRTRDRVIRTAPATPSGTHTVGNL